MRTTDETKCEHNYRGYCPVCRVLELPASDTDIDEAIKEWERVTGDPCGSMDNPCYQDCMEAAGEIEDQMAIAMPFIARNLIDRSIIKSFMDGVK
jgi:hypothetical protein